MNNPTLLTRRQFTTFFFPLLVFTHIAAMEGKLGRETVTKPRPRWLSGDLNSDPHFNYSHGTGTTRTILLLLAQHHFCFLSAVLHWKEKAVASSASLSVRAVFKVIVSFLWLFLITPILKFCVGRESNLIIKSDCELWTSRAPNVRGDSCPGVMGSLIQ